MDIELLSKAIENSNNANIINKTASILKSDINNILQKLQLKKNILKEYNKKLKNYMYIDSINDLKIGHSIKYIKIDTPDNIILSRNFIICNINSNDNGIIITLKTFNNKFFTIYFHNFLIFKKFNDEEKVIIQAFSLL
tara:strand:+ start:111 stop:524 length:414 start_codon:yes stop_codon:yes gene_type:complete